MYYDVRMNCKVCGKDVDGEGNSEICTFCYNNHPELHYNDCPCLNCQRKRATATNADISWGHDKEPDILPLCQKCGTIAKKNDFYGFWCPQCNSYPDFTPPPEKGVMGTKYQTWEELHTMWGIPQ